MEASKKVIKTIGTHSGTFHCDDVTAVMMLKNYLGAAKEAEVVRTRDETVLSTLSLVLDVGGEYNHEKCRYDHHQKSFDTKFKEDGIVKLSAAGLIYKHYGEEIVLNALKELKETLGLDIDLENQSVLDLVYNDFYDSFMKPIDAQDNGMNAYSTKEKPLYTDLTTLPMRVARLNGMWLNQNVNFDEQFKIAMEVARKDFLENLCVTA